VVPATTVIAGYITTGGDHFYPILEGIICLLPTSNSTLHDNVRGVQAFYEDYGWQRDEAGRFHDSVLFIEQKNAVAQYYETTMERLHQFLEPKGTYLLDIASGPVFQPENQALSRNFDKRICIDITFRALVEARRNIGDDKGIFIHGDITNIPLAEGVCDNAMSIHTLYHVPQELQEKAVRELFRVTKPGANVIILYNWAWHSWLMNVLLLPVRVVKAFKRLYRYLTVSASERWLSGGLYFYPHPPGWFERLAHAMQARLSFHSLTSIHQDFVKYYVHDGFGGAALLRAVLKLEARFPRYLGRHGAFGYIVLNAR
jgi:SAM-dependent methyltransferase